MTGVAVLGGTVAFLCILLAALITHWFDTRIEDELDDKCSEHSGGTDE